MDDIIKALEQANIASVKLTDDGKRCRFSAEFGLLDLKKEEVLKLSEQLYTLANTMKSSS